MNKLNFIFFFLIIINVPEIVFSQEIDNPTKEGEWEKSDRCSLKDRFTDAVKFHCTKYANGEYTDEEFVGNNGIFNTLEKRGNVYKAINKIQKQNGSEIEFFELAANTVDMLDLICMWSKTYGIATLWIQPYKLSDDGVANIEESNRDVLIHLTKNIFPYFLEDTNPPIKGKEANALDLNIICQEQNITQNMYNSFSPTDKATFIKISRFGDTWWQKTLQKIQEVIYSFPQLLTGRCGVNEWNQPPPPLPDYLDISVYEDRLIHYITTVAKLSSLSLEEKNRILCDECKYINPDIFKYCLNSNPTQHTASTLFLFDLSGSMNSSGKSGQAKLQEAKQAADATLTSIATDNASGGSNEVCVMGFQGSCGSPISTNTKFKSDLASIKQTVGSLRAHGGTPLVEAIEIAECELVKQLNKQGQSTGKLIVLSDGQATCRKIRPDETYIYGQSGKLTKNILSNQNCGNDILAIRQAGNGAKYYTIGFNIAPGSAAERDLQYLAQASGGKYLNVQSRDQLEKAFKKFNRTYIPKSDPALNNLPQTAKGQFKQSVTEIKAESFLTALATCEFFVKSHPKDCHGVYNLALMQEANDLFREAAQSYETYLSLCPTANDKNYVNKQIKRLEEEHRQHILFQKQVVISDLDYLKKYYQSLFNQRNEVLAKEFKGFVKEKGKFYQNLPKILNMENEQWLIDASKDLSRGLKRTARSVDDPEFDRIAVSLLTFPIETLEGIVEQLKKI